MESCLSVHMKNHGSSGFIAQGEHDTRFEHKNFQIWAQNSGIYRVKSFFVVSHVAVMDTINHEILFTTPFYRARDWGIWFFMTVMDTWLGSWLGDLIFYSEHAKNHVHSEKGNLLSAKIKCGKSLMILLWAQKNHWGFYFLWQLWTP